MLAEVGSKDADFIMAPYVWVEQIERDLDAGAWKVIAEARESGTAGIYRANGEVRTGLIDEIAHAIDPSRLIFDAPLQRAAGVAAQALRHRVQPRQHRARRRALAGDAAPRPALGHGRALRSGRRRIDRGDASTEPTTASAGARDRLRAARGRLLRGVLRHAAAQAHADRRPALRADAALLAHARRVTSNTRRSRSSSPTPTR